MSYPTNQGHPQYPGAPGAGGGAPPHGGGAYGPPPARAASAVRDDGLDAIPMQKTKPGLIMAIAVGVLVVGALTAWSVFGGKKTTAKDVEDLKAKVAASADEDGMSPKERLEHIRRTQAAMEKYEADEQQRTAAEAAKKRAEEEESSRKEAAKSGGGGPAPVSGTAAKKASDSLDSIGADYASKLGGN